MGVQYEQVPVIWSVVVVLGHTTISYMLASSSQSIFLHELEGVAVPQLVVKVDTVAIDADLSRGTR